MDGSIRQEIIQSFTSLAGLALLNINYFSHIFVFFAQDVFYRGVGGHAVRFGGAGKGGLLFGERGWFMLIFGMVFGYAGSHGGVFIFRRKYII